MTAFLGSLVYAASLAISALVTPSAGAAKHTAPPGHAPRPSPVVSASSKIRARPSAQPAPSPSPSPSPSPTPRPKPSIVETHDPALAKKVAEELAQVRASKPDAPARWIEEAKLLYYQGLSTPGKPERQKLFDEGRTIARKALDKDSDNPAAIGWWAANEANYADAVANVSSLRSLSKVEDALLKLRRIDENFEADAADRGLGRLYHKAPSFLSVGSESRARDAFKRAMDKHPEHPGTRVYYAQFLAEQGKCEDARKLAESVYDSKDLEKYPYDRPSWNLMAAEILLGAKGKCPGGG